MGLAYWYGMCMFNHKVVIYTAYVLSIKFDQNH